MSKCYIVGNLVHWLICNCYVTGAMCDTPKTACDSAPCFNDGECVANGDDLFVCLCTAGYEGLLCQNRIDACFSQPCANHADCITCEDCQQGFTCVCKDGFKGRIQPVSAPPIFNSHLS